MRIIGIDPGLQKMGWGVIDAEGSSLRYVAAGTVGSTAGYPLADRLCQLYDRLTVVIEAHNPDQAAVEETFVNVNPVSTLKLGAARGVALVVPARMGLPVGEYPANLIKKSVVGNGHANKDQVEMMIRTLMPTADFKGADAADALAVAITHAHHGQTRKALGGKMAGAAR
ncbi:MAG: crossover junction endodeoxyribonuclease RuvC [Alphaproteobacteria bacterium]